jgi:hypothetical protein
MTTKKKSTGDEMSKLKAKLYEAWKKNHGKLDSKAMHELLFKMADGKFPKNTVAAWPYRWRNGKNLPEVVAVKPAAVKKPNATKKPEPDQAQEVSE